jgi:iron complex outermembrane recepter protein
MSARRAVFIPLILVSIVVASAGTAPAQNLAAPAAQTPPQGQDKPQQPALAQAKPDEVPPVNFDVVVTAARQDVPLKDHPAATAVVAQEVLDSMPRGVAAEEALRLVPGVKVDNQANQERVHVSIRGQGLLTERGVRGIKVLLDGLPLNDPTGFAPDLFDVDWLGVRRIEVMRGPASALYGGGSAGGVLNIETRDGGRDPLAGEVSIDGGSNGFMKGYGEAGGTRGNVNYRVSLSRNAGDGYRVHTAFDATNLYGKARWKSGRTTLTFIGAGTHYFNENPEGLNEDQVAEDPTQPNPDAIKYNEYQRTNRATAGVAGRVAIADNQDLSFSTYYRRTGWVESVPSSVQHRTYDSPGAIAQYNLAFATGRVTHHVTAGADLDFQWIDDYRHPNLGNAVEGEALLADQNITQTNAGFYALDRMEVTRQVGIMVDARADHITNELTDHLQPGGADLSGRATFDKATARVGASWNPKPDFGVYASFGQGFLPPSTEELANNPEHLGGFNQGLVPATSLGEEIGVRGTLRHRLSYDLAFFHMTTENDFGRYRVPGRPLETFYRNAGDSRRYGVETGIDWLATPALSIRSAYTFSHYKYDQVQSLFGDFSDVFMPNAPRHQLGLDAEYRAGRHWVADLGLDAASSWYIDFSNQTWTDAYVLVNPRVAYRWSAGSYQAEIHAAARNLVGTQYIAFTEPDPDGNSYQPGPTREFFVGMRLRFGR